VNRPHPPQPTPDPWGRPTQPPTPTPPGTRGSPAPYLFLAFVLAAALTVAIVVVVVSLGGRTGSQAAPPPSPEQRPVDTATPERTAEPTEDDESLMQQGWQRADVPKWGLVYEVPGEEGWRIANPVEVHSFEGDDGTALGMSGVSTYLDSPCAGWGSRALLGAQGITDAEDTDTEEMAEATARAWAYYGYRSDGEKPEVTTRSVAEFSANGLEGHHAVVDVTVPGSDGECVPAEAVVHAVVVPAQEDEEGLRAFVMLLDQGLPDTLDGETVGTILSTLRDADHEV